MFNSEKPNPFVVIVDKDGNPVKSLLPDISANYVQSVVDLANQENPQLAPHKAFEIIDTTSFRPIYF
jgi:hypothetical protein